MTGDEVSTLTDQDEDALETIRRQLDLEFPHWSGNGQPARADTVRSRTAWPERRTTSRARRTATTAATLLLACAAGSAAGVLVTVLSVKRVVSPAAVRDVPTAELVTVTRPPLPARRPVALAATPPEPRAERIVERPTVRRPATIPKPDAAAPAAPTARIAPLRLAPLPPAAYPPVEHQSAAAPVPAAAAPVPAAAAPLPAAVAPLPAAVAPVPAAVPTPAPAAPIASNRQDHPQPGGQLTPRPVASPPESP
jgi:hypothetical protein